MKSFAYLALLAGALSAQLAVQSAAVAASAAADTPSAISQATAAESPGSAVEVSFGATLDLLRNVSGGIAKGGRPIAHLEFDLGADLGTSLGWPGSSAFFSLIYDGGGRINTERVGSQMGVSNIEVPVSTYRIYQASLLQKFADDRASVLFGLYPIDTEFQVMDAASVFLQPQYGVTAELGLTRGPSIFNNTALGLRLKALSEDRSSYALAAVLDGLPGDPNNPKGTHVKFGKGDGIMSIAEIGIKPAHGTPWSALPAENMNHASEAIEKYAVGYWHYSVRADDLIDLDLAGSPTKRRSSGWYALAERTLYRGDGTDWAGFIRLSGTDGDSTPLKRAVNIGMSAQGLFGRADDSCGIAYSRATLSDKYRAAQALAGTDTNAFESAWELTYRIPIGKSLAVQPDLQRIDHPGGDRTRPAAIIVGTRIEVTY